MYRNANDHDELIHTQYCQTFVNAMIAKMPTLLPRYISGSEISPPYEYVLSLVSPSVLATA